VFVWLRDRVIDDRLIDVSICGIRFRGTLREMCQLATLRWTPPALAPVFEAALPRGGVLADVGSFLGMYALWGARCVGPEGTVHAFEPIPGSCQRVREYAALNGFSNVEVVPGAVGAEPGRIELQLAAGKASLGVTSRYLGAAGVSSIAVEQTTLDAFYAGRRGPDLVKIDVEGMEAEVLRGARALLTGDRAPVVVFEAHIAERADGYAEILEFLGGLGCQVWSLQRRGIRPEPKGTRQPGSMNALATRPDLDRHRAVVARLARARFSRNQSE
jgi:FkbM family methyltransferase